MDFEWIIFERINARAIEKKQYLPTIKTLLQYSRQAEMEGLLTLEDIIPEMKDPFLASGIQFIVDGIDPDFVREILQRKIILSDESPERIFEYCIIASGILGIQEGYKPRMLREYLQSFMGNIIIPEYEKDFDSKYLME